jgi:hypothetical protein
MKLTCLLALLVLAGCNEPSTETVVQGDRSVTQVSAGILRNGKGDVRTFYIIRDPLTKLDYLVVIDAGIIQLGEKPGVER